MRKKDDTNPRKLPSTAFAAGNPYRFAEGVSGNPSGRPAANERRLVSRALHEHLAHRAPDKVTQKFGLSAGASWAQVVSMSLIFAAVKGDVAAAREIRDAVGDSVAKFGPLTGDEGESRGGHLVVQFVSTTAPGETLPVTLEAGESKGG